MAIIHTFEKAKERIENARGRAEFIRLWSQHRPFISGLWDVSNSNTIYKIISHPQFTGRLIPNSSDITDEFIKTGNKIWNQLKNPQVRQEYRGYIRVLRGKLKPDR